VNDPDLGVESDLTVAKRYRIDRHDLKKIRQAHGVKYVGRRLRCYCGRTFQAYGKGIRHCSRDCAAAYQAALEQNRGMPEEIIVLWALRTRLTWRINGKQTSAGETRRWYRRPTT
jgi:hypothetical protein